MLDCISVENMRLSDAWTIVHQVSSLELMRRAAYGVYLAVQWAGPVAIVVGSGNNGGDGFALACILKEQGIGCTVFTVSQRLSQDSAYYAEQAREAGVPVFPLVPACLCGFKIVVDCLLGTGFQGELRDNYRSAIEEINRTDAYVVSVDINSGMNGDTGAAALAVQSDLTVTIGYVKKGLITENAGACMKRLVCADIGIVLRKEENSICTPEEWESLCIKHGLLMGQRIVRLDGKVFYRCPAWLEMNLVRAF